MIERMLVLCETKPQKEKMERELMFKSTENIRAMYESAKPKLEARREQLNRIIRRQKRREDRIKYLHQQEELGRAWQDRWVHPRVAYPLRPKFNFGLADLQHMAMFLLRLLKDQDAVIRARRPAMSLSVAQY